MNFRRLLAIALILLLAQRHGFAQQYESPLSANAQQFIKWGSDWFNQNQSQMRSVRISTYWDSNGGEVHEVRTGTRTGARAKFVLCPEGGKTYLQKLEINSSAIKVPSGIQIGCTAQEIKNALGAPSERKGNKLKYEEGDPFVDSVSFSFKNGRLFAISWSFELD